MIISACLLAGGNATRMNGFPKGNLIIHGKTFIQHLIDEIEKCNVSNIIISANSSTLYEQYKKPIVSDIHKNKGPISGIQSALHYFSNQSTATLFLPCDLPNLTSNEIKMLMDQFNENLVYASTKNQTHPLCCVIQNDLLSEISSLIEKNERKIEIFWQKMKGASVFFENELAFKNVNYFSV